MRQASKGTRRTGVFGALVVVLLIAVGIGLPNSAQAQGQRVTLDQAIRQGLVAAEFHGSGDLFFQESIAYRLTNKQPTTVYITVPAGYILEPVDSSYQRLVVGKDYEIVLCGTGRNTPTPGGTPCASTTAQGKWYGFCINLSRHAPDQDTQYKAGEMATGQLLQVVQTINRKGAAGRLGAQFAVWRVTDDFTLESISSSDMQNSELLRLIAPLLGVVRPELDLAQSILEDSKTGLVFYTGTPPANLLDPGTLLQPGSRTGIPEVDSLKKQAEDTLRNLAIASGLTAGVCVVGCLGLVGVIVLFVLRKR